MAPSRFRARRVVLDDGTLLTIRAICSGDQRALRTAFRKLSPESRYRRFNGHFSDLSDAMLRYLTEVDGIDHFAVVAVVESPSPRLPGPLSLLEGRRASEIVGVARMIRLQGTAAEVAVTVADSFQGRGVGSRLMKILVARAKRVDVDTFIAHVSPSNTAMLRLLEQSGTVASTPDAVSTFLPSKARAHLKSWRPYRLGRIHLVLAMRWVRGQRGTA